jgi:hypothetical protein
MAGQTRDRKGAGARENVPSGAAINRWATHAWHPQTDSLKEIRTLTTSRPVSLATPPKDLGAGRKVTLGGRVTPKAGVTPASLCPSSVGDLEGELRLRFADIDRLQNSAGLLVLPRATRDRPDVALWLFVLAEEGEEGLRRDLSFR